MLRAKSCIKHHHTRQTSDGHVVHRKKKTLGTSSVSPGAVGVSVWASTGVVGLVEQATTAERGNRRHCC